MYKYLQSQSVPLAQTPNEIDMDPKLKTNQIDYDDKEDVEAQSFLYKIELW